MQVLEPTCKYVDNQTLCLEENADRARSFSLTRPHWREGLLLCQRICIVSVFIAKILKIVSTVVKVIEIIIEIIKKIV